MKTSFLLQLTYPKTLQKKLARIEPSIFAAAEPGYWNNSNLACQHGTNDVMCQQDRQAHTQP